MLLCQHRLVVGVLPSPDRPVFAPRMPRRGPRRGCRRVIPLPCKGSPRGRRGRCRGPWPRQPILVVRRLP
jgi:hypothetical protein